MVSEILQNHKQEAHQGSKSAWEAGLRMLPYLPVAVGQ